MKDLTQIRRHCHTADRKPWLRTVVPPGTLRTAIFALLEASDRRSFLTRPLVHGYRTRKVNQFLRDCLHFFTEVAADGT